MPWELPQVMDREMAGEGLKHFAQISGINGKSSSRLKTPYSRVAVLESSRYMRNQLLRDADWAGMAHSVEIRTPYVDFEFLKRMAGPIIRQQKTTSKEDLANAPEIPLPEEVTERRKTGFTVPISKWLEQENAGDAWKDIRLLTRKNCHWSRRWAYEVIQKS